MKEAIFKKDGTAQGVAKQRLIESLAKPDKRLINDPYADNYVAGAGLIKIMGHKFSIWITKKFVDGFHEHLISRTRFIDDLIENMARKGLEQYVILGAGYDARAHRLNLPSSLKIFEVDRPEVQMRKRARLPKDVPNSENLSYVSLDFNQDSLKASLLASGFDPDKSTVFTLEGVSQYISKKALDTTIKELAELSQSKNTSLYLSYVDSNLGTNPELCFGKGYPNPAKKAETIMRLTAKFGEPWISLFSAEEIKNILHKHGFSLIENKTLADLNHKYFAPVGRALSEDQIFNLEHSAVAKMNNTKKQQSL